jgi:hypothetical protein
VWREVTCGSDWITIYTITLLSASCHFFLILLFSNFIYWHLHSLTSLVSVLVFWKIIQSTTLFYFVNSPTHHKLWQTDLLLTSLWWRGL